MHLKRKILSCKRKLKTLKINCVSFEIAENKWNNIPRETSIIKIMCTMNKHATSIHFEKKMLELYPDFVFKVGTRLWMNISSDLKFLLLSLVLFQFCPFLLYGKFLTYFELLLMLGYMLSVFSTFINEPVNLSPYILNECFLRRI